MAKINISVPDEFLKELDQLTQELTMSRSELLRKAVERFRIAWDKEKEEEQVRARRREACKMMDDIRGRVGKMPPGWDSTKIIREWRDRDRLTRLKERQP